jgi:hypothetical protein
MKPDFSWLFWRVSLLAAACVSIIICLMLVLEVLLGLRLKI